MTERDKLQKMLLRDKQKMLAFVRLLASYGCAGNCDEPSIDIQTGKKEGSLCGPCAATEWLNDNGLNR